MKTLKTLIIVLLTGFLAVSCSKQVTRIDSEEVRDLSGKWNDTDSRLVAEEMIEDCLSKPWYSNMYVVNNKIPAMVVGEIRNKSHEHISVETFIKDMERTLINSGKVDFVANKYQREELRSEIRSQDENAREDTKKMYKQELGADLMLVGSVNSIIDKEGDETVRFYQVNLELIDIETHRKLWIGDKKIKKYVEKNKFKL